MERSPQLTNLALLTENFGAVVERDPEFDYAYIIKFEKEGIITTIRISFKDQSGADLAITNITTLPEEALNKGSGSQALRNLLAWAKENNLNNARAVQVQDNSENFWLKNGFRKCDESNPCNDFIYEGRNWPTRILG